jgi:hypothetical protein
MISFTFVTNDHPANEASLPHQKTLQFAGSGKESK